MTLTLHGSLTQGTGENPEWNVGLTGTLPMNDSFGWNLTYTFSIPGSYGVTFGLANQAGGCQAYVGITTT